MATTVRIVCVSDTHNDDLTGHVPDGDILLHAGDMTDDGTYDELEKALKWIQRLPHKLKIIIPGNHDLGLDRAHEIFDPKALDLFTSPAVRSDGVIFLDGSEPQLFYNSLISIYGNPAQPDFLNSKYAFTYLPYLNPESKAAWAQSPTARHTPIDLWLTHGAPRGRLDKIPIPGLMGCEAQRQKVAAVRPLICVFGHYHVSYGVERVVWRNDVEGTDDDRTGQCKIVTGEDVDGVYDFTNLKGGEESIFINAAWMTGEKRLTEKRNKPIVMDLKLPS
jgi:3',5'-cyclic AMP phosphodiesterase CpdA